MINKTRKLGISIYPASQNYEEMKKYVELASKYGFTRIFSSMLEVNEKNKEKTIANFSQIFSFARKKRFDVCLDVNPEIFSLLGVKYNNLELFNKMHVSTIRLDLPLNGKTEAEMTFNPYGINIEVNISNGTEYVSNILSYKPNKDKLIACHNFYPQKNTGLDYKFFLKITKTCKNQGIRTAAFVSSKTAKKGPWSISEGLPTLEMHRNMDLEIQAKHLFATNLIDDVIIGNACALESELKALSQVDKYKIKLKVELNEKTSKIEEAILQLDNHYRRGDINTNFIRSTMSRVNYKKESFPCHDNNLSQEKGNIYICNNDFNHYKGELHVALEKLENDNRKNLIGKVIKEELFLINFIDSWSKFSFSVDKAKK